MAIRQQQLEQDEPLPRPSFALNLERERGDDRLVVNELLSAEQAEARRQRFEYIGTDVHVKSIDEAFTKDALSEQPHSWEGWRTIRVASLNGQRYTVLRNRLLSNAVEIEELDEERVLFVQESVGVRIALATLALAPLSKLESMQQIVEGIANMAGDECYYWHTLCRSPNDLDGAKALRTLFR